MSVHQACVWILISHSEPSKSIYQFNSEKRDEWCECEDCAAILINSLGNSVPAKDFKYGVFSATLECMNKEYIDIVRVSLISMMMVILN